MNYPAFPPRFFQVIVPLNGKDWGYLPAFASPDCYTQDTQRADGLLFFLHKKHSFMKSPPVGIAEATHQNHSKSLPA